MAKDTSFEQFLRRRNAASAAWVAGNAQPLSELLARKGEATFFGPVGGTISGAKKVAARYATDAARFSPGGTNKIKVLHADASGDLGYAVFHQVAKVKMAGQPKQVPMTLRVTEIFRRDGGEWRLVHRHADMLAKPQPPK